MKNWGLDQIGFTVVPTLFFDMTKAKALYQNLNTVIYEKFCSCLSISICTYKHHHDQGGCNVGRGRGPTTHEMVVCTSHHIPAIQIWHQNPV